MRTMFFLIFLWATISQAAECKVFHQDQDLPSMNINLEKYQSEMKVCQASFTKHTLVSLRKISVDRQTWFLVVQPQTLQTALVSESCLSSCRESLADQLSNIYGNELVLATSAPFPLRNDGVSHSSLSRQQLFLTVDLCPSKKPLDRSFFEDLMKKRRSVPLAISLSGGWIRDHQADLQWLKDAQKVGALRITWVNHSNTHPYHVGEAWEHNFLLSESVDLKSEVLGAEIEFFKEGILPSVFFRFPGLISNEVKMSQLRGLGMIPLGADAWLARGDEIKNGSVILVHGNGNEPQGLALFDQKMRSLFWPLLSDLSRLFF